MWYKWLRDESLFRQHSKHSYLEHQCPLMDEAGSIFKETRTPWLSPRQNQYNTHFPPLPSPSTDEEDHGGLSGEADSTPSSIPHKRNICSYQVSHS